MSAEDQAQPGGTAPVSARPTGRLVRRWLAHRPALAGLGVLLLVVVACLVGPSLVPHPYDRVYPDYVGVPAGLEAHPSPEQIDAALRRIAARLRVQAEAVTVGGDIARVTLVGPRPIDRRGLVLFERSDLFGPARLVEAAEEGRRLVVEAPVERHRFPFGTDVNGRDLLSRSLKAGQVSLGIGLLASLVALAIGVLYGAVSGYAGGVVDAVMMRIVDILYALPFVFFVILLVVFFGRNMVLVFLAVGAVEWLDMARIVRGRTLSLKQREFVQAAEALGVSPWGVLRRHIIPNTLTPVLVTLTVLVPRVILLESFLSFLGLGVQEPLTSWGALIAEGARTIESGAWMLVFPSLLLTGTLLALNAVGDGLREALDPGGR